MKTKMFTSMITILLVAGMILALPVANVQAVSQKVIHFTGTGYFTGLIPPTNVQQIGKCTLEIGTQVFFHFDSDDSRMTGDNHNTLNGLTKPNGKSTMWGTFVFDGDISGRVSGQANFAKDELTAHYVGYGPTYKVIWRYIGGFGAGDISGIIIEK